MNLDFLNNIGKSIKGSNIIENFVQELSKYLENNLNNGSEISIIEKAEQKMNITSNYRDKIKLEQNNILNSYAKETANQGNMYFIYSKSKQNQDMYNMYCCSEGRSNKVITIEKENLPKEAGIDSVLREKNGTYTLDKEGTNNIKEQLTNTINKLLEEQAKELDKLRIELNIYEVVEKSKDRVWLKNQTSNDGNIFEEIAFSKEYIKNIKEGNKFQYINGEYKLYST